MPINDNGFTFSKRVGKVDVRVTQYGGYEQVSFTGSLSQMQDWLVEALVEINNKIEEVG